MPTSQNQPLKVGLIGYGYVGRVFHIPYIQAAPGLKLASVCSSQHETVQKAHPDVTVVGEVAQLCADTSLDVIVIASPNDTHRPYAERALRAGKHVVVDKPFTLTTEDATAVLNTAREMNRKVFVFQNRRWDSDFLAMKQVILERRLGVLQHFESAMDLFDPEVSTNWRFGNGEGAGRWFDLAPHLVDQALLLFGAPKMLSADLQCLREKNGATDWFLVTLHYPELNAILRGSMVARVATPRFVMHGTKGSAIKIGHDQQEAQLVAGIAPTDAQFGLDSDPLTITDLSSNATQITVPRGSQATFYKELATALQQGSAPLTTEAQMTAVMCIVETASRAAKEGRRLPVTMDPAHRQALKRDALYKPNGE